MFSIGEFSKITGLTVKTLRFYHERRVLLPSCVDDQTGYRFYDESQIETARMIGHLRDLDFSLQDIAEILQSQHEDTNLLALIEQHKRALEAKVRRLSEIVLSLDHVLKTEREAHAAMHASTFDVEEKVVDTLLIAGIRMKGPYKECGKGFGRIGKTFGRQICGKPMLLIYDKEYKEEDADFEACMPIQKGTAQEGISVRDLPGGRCVSLLHKGPYQDLGRSYERILKYAKEKHYEIAAPCREVYLKGPGLIFKGNPRNYLTEIQMMVTSE